MQFTQQQFAAFRADLKAAVAEVERKYQVNIVPQKISYSNYSFDLKLVVNKNDEGFDFERKEFEDNCSLFGFQCTDYKRVFNVDGDSYELYGFETGRRKNPCKIRNVRTGKTYVCPRSYLIPPTITGHSCRYCGGHVNGNNPDELCDHCKETFGHSLFSEL